MTTHVVIENYGLGAVDVHIEDLPEGVPRQMSLFEMGLGLSKSLWGLAPEMPAHLPAIIQDENTDGNTGDHE